MNTKILLPLVFLLSITSFNALAQSTPRTIINNPNNVDRVKMYTWVDEKGIRHYTDDKKKAAPGASNHVITTPKVKPPVRHMANNGPVNSKSGLPPLPPSANIMNPPSDSMPLGLPPLPPPLGE